MGVTERRFEQAVSSQMKSPCPRQPQDRGNLFESNQICQSLDHVVGRCNLDVADWVGLLPCIEMAKLNKQSKDRLLRALGLLHDGCHGRPVAISHFAKEGGAVRSEEHTSE